MLRTIELPISETLFQRLEQAARSAGISTADFIQHLLGRSLREWTVEE